MPSLNPIGTPFIELLSVDSTNNYAMGLIHAAMAQHGTAVFAHEQLKGKGQRNRQWISAGKMNIALSMVLEPPGMINAELFLLSMAVANGVANFCNHYADGDMQIKWPNDIYWRDRKAAGILIENVWQGSRWKYAVAGVGININQVDFGELQSKAVSLRQITGRHFDPLIMAKALCTHMEAAYRQLINDPGEVCSLYQQRLYKKGELVRLKKDNRHFEARICSVSNMGELVVQHSVEERFSVGEVEWIG